MEPFQEWPQLLDLHLKGIVEGLASAFIEYLSHYASSYRNDARNFAESKKSTLPRAVCKILYVLCKIRGQKIIVQLLNNEAKYMEPMLSALETWSKPDISENESRTTKIGMIWEEKFIMLLWLSHFMLAPFDLVTMASDDVGLSSDVPSMTVDFLENTPPVARRLVSLCIYYIGVASKERETASVLLARLALRRDMRSVGLQRTLIDWALSSLDGSRSALAPISIHALIGILSFLARIITSADSDVLWPLLTPIYSSVHHARIQYLSLQSQITSSAVARKLVIKISRALAVAGIKIGSAGLDEESSLEEDTLEEVIDQLLTALEDKDTSVRVAASKALSVISRQLEPDMVVQIVETLLEKLKEDTLPGDSQNNQPAMHSELAILSSGSPLASSELSLANVNVVKWHGLVLTVSQLIFHGSMPTTLTYEALKALFLALSFEQRASSGAAIGTNVRDAACFGLWALARRYTTMELSKYNFYDGSQGSIFQTLATQLVIAATLDPAGNIRRGASAALQELIGRHPNTIVHGIRLVEVVDYNAVALRSRAITEVAVGTSKIDKIYWDTILNGLLGWRGVASPDIQSRRHAAKAIGLLTLSSTPNTADMVTIQSARKCLRKTALSSINKRHGSLLALAEIMLATLEYTSKAKAYLENPPIDEFQIVNLPVDEAAELWRVFYTDSPGSLLGVDNTALFKGDIASHLDSPLIAEAVCFLISTLATSASLPTSRLYGTVPEPSVKDVQMSIKILNTSLRQSDPMIVLRSSQAAESLFHLLDSQAQEELILQWADLLPFGSKMQGRSTLGVIAALGAVFVQAGSHKLSAPATKTTRAILERCGYSEEANIVSPLRAFITHTLLDQINPANSIDVRCATLRSLTSGVFESEGITSRLFMIYPGTDISSDFRKHGSGTSCLSTRPHDQSARRCRLSCSYGNNRCCCHGPTQEAA